MAGLAKVDPDTLHVTPYSEADGLPNSTQNLFSSAVLDDGTILFPGDSSLVLVRPDRLQPWTYKAPLVLTTITAPDEKTSPAVAAQQAMKDGFQLLSHRGFHADFALLDYTYPATTRYAYRLEGFDTGWTEVDDPTQAGATYTNLPPGDYRFQVRATSRGGQGPTTSLDVPLQVTARFYETSGFRAFCVLAVVAGVIVFVRIRVAFMARQQSALEREIAQRTADLKQNQRELMRANERLAELALHDTLTGLLNRRGFYERAEIEGIRSQRSGKAFSLLLVDLDNFKSINDTLGHVAGDECLKAVARALLLNLRPTDIIARYGGEEMILLLPETDEEIALRLAERLRLAIAELQLSHRSQPISLTISIGLTSSYQSKDMDQLIVVVDKALYAAKHDGKNCVRTAY
jgi:diguanylate cyclase (GGDEF)-like protein